MTVLRIKSGAGGTTWEEVGGVGIGVPAGGSAGQILTKTSAADYATAWSSTLPVLANNTYLQGYRADGTTAQSLIGVRTDNNIALGTGLPTNGRVVLSNTVWLSGLRTNATIQDLVFVNSDDSVHVAYATPKPLYLGQAAQDDIFIGGSLAAGKNIYVPRLTVQGDIMLDATRWLTSSGGLLLMFASGTTYLAHNTSAQFNTDAGMTTFARDVNVLGTLSKGGVAYTHPGAVLEHHYTGRIERFRASYGAANYEGRRPFEALERFLAEECRLPAVRTIDRLQVFERCEELTMGLEEAYLYLLDLHARISALEGRP